MKRLVYIGRGDAFYNVPARDLTDEDFAERAETWKEFGITEELLVKSGLYKTIEEKPKQNKAAKEGK